MYENLIKTNKYFSDKDLTYAFDNLTHVFLRKQIMDYAKYLVENHIDFSLAIVDIDNFKYINDSYGHLVGDKVLVELASHMAQIIGDKGVLGRYGGDEFIIVFEGITSYDEIWQIFHTLNFDIAKKTYGGEEQIPLSVTAGIARYPLDSDTLNLLTERTDKALYRGKTKGRNCFIIYLKEKHENIELKTRKEAFYTSTDVHSRIFKALTKNKDVSKNVKTVLSFLSQYLMIDHISFETKNGIFVEITHPIARFKEFAYLDVDAIFKALNNFGLFSVNNVEFLHSVGNENLYKLLTEQKIKACACASVEAFNMNYGVLRFDMCQPRIWQSHELDLLICVARTVGILLYYNKLKIEELD